MKALSALFLPALLLPLLIPDTARADCANPTASAGEVVFNKDYCVMQFCNGLNWIPTGKPDPQACNNACSVPDLVAHWKLDESSGTTASSVIGGYTGGLNNGPVWNPSGGKKGGALAFDGVNDYMAVPSSAAFDSNGTWMFWFKTNGIWGTDGGNPSDIANILGRHNSSSSFRGIHISLYPPAAGRPVVEMKNDSGAVCNFSSVFTGLTDNTWHHVAVAYAKENGATNQIYVDGLLAGSCTNSAAWSFNNQTIRFGDSADTHWEEYQGLLDDVRFYGRKLTSGEVSTIYNGAGGCQ